MSRGEKRLKMRNNDWLDITLLILTATGLITLIIDFFK